ncbi:MAG: CPBP family intramembrane glutamic endopeptidase [Gemmatimonadota bacterium]
MRPVLLDYLITALLLVVAPLYARWSYRRFQERVRSGGPAARRRQYLGGMLRQWLLTALVMVWWFAAGRTRELLGLTLPLDLRSVLGIGVTLAGILFLFAQWRAVSGLDRATLAGLAGHTDGVADLLPHTQPEASTFRWLSLTAGVCEEVLYRGYLIAVLAVFTGLWTAALLAGVAFGLAHAYQGRAGVLKTGIIGLGAALLFVATGSLLWPMALHTAIDLHGGAVGRKILEAVAAEGAAASAASAASESQVAG